MKVQICVTSINLWSKYTKPCLESIQVAMMRAKKRGITCRLLLIDNGSTDETSREASKMVNDIFAHQRNEDRWGFQKSVNFGVADAWERGFDYVLMCNNDILLHPEAIWRLVARFEGGVYKDKENNELPIGMITAMDVRGEMKPEELANFNANTKADVEEAPHPNFSAFMVSKECWELIGEFDELFAPAYHEDNCYHYRMQLAGIAAIVLPTALFYHYGSGTQREAMEDGSPMVSNLMFEASREKYQLKWGGSPAHETFETPYNDPDKSIRSTIQNPEA